jgi:hypothetical protein
MDPATDMVDICHPDNEYKTYLYSIYNAIPFYWLRWLLIKRRQTTPLEQRWSGMKIVATQLQERRTLCLTWVTDKDEHVYKYVGCGLLTAGAAKFASTPAQEGRTRLFSDTETLKLFLKLHVTLLKRVSVQSLLAAAHADLLEVTKEC